MIALLLIGCAPREEPEIRTTAARELMVRERVIARDVADARVSDGRILFTQLPPGAAIAPDTVGKLVMIDLAAGTRRVIDDHPTNSNPFVVPGSDDVLFVSSRSGMASLYLARPGHPPRRLTNAGVRDLGDPRWVPVPGKELRFDGRVAEFTARYGGVESRWRVDVDTGAAERLP